MKKIGHGLWRTWLLRVGFYGLFALSCVLISEADVTQCQISRFRSQMQRSRESERQLNEMQQRVSTLNTAGFLCATGWTIWLGLAFGCKLLNKMRRFIGNKE